VFGAMKSRCRQVLPHPDTPFTSACPPSFPSVPTSLDAGHLGAELFSWSTSLLTVSLSCRISPRASPVIFLRGRPAPPQVVTRRCLRTWAVRLFAGG